MQKSLCLNLRKTSMSYFIPAKSHLFVSWPWCTAVPIELAMSNGALLRIREKKCQMDPANLDTQQN
jgi:hypothetical protein